MKKNNLLIPELKAEYLTKDILHKYSDSITDTETPLKSYIIVKGLETICKNILDNKQFRNAVKEDFINQSGGAISKTELYGVTIGTTSQEKKNELAKDYIYSAEVKSLENDIELLKLQLKAKQDLLKGMKLQEINNGTAKEVLSGFVPVKDTNPLDSFNLTVTFK